MKLIYFKWRGCNSSNSISIFLSFFKQFYLFLIAPPRSFWNVLILESVYDLFKLRNVKNVYINSYEYHIKKFLMNSFAEWQSIPRYIWRELFHYISERWGSDIETVTWWAEEKSEEWFNLYNGAPFMVQFGLLLLPGWFARSCAYKLFLLLWFMYMYVCSCSYDLCICMSADSSQDKRAGSCAFQQDRFSACK